MSLVARAVDALLEASVVGSFTRLGPALRRRLDHWAPLEGRDVSGRVFVVTGATSGLGLATARMLARMRGTVVLIGRDAAKCARVRRSIAQDMQGADVHCVVADMGDLDAVRRAADAIRALTARVDVLIHNAGALDDVRSESPQGIETTVATHVVGPWLLTHLLRPELARAAPSRVLWVSSGGMYAEPLDAKDLEMPADRYDGVRQYAKAKRAQVTLVPLLAERLAADGVVVHAMHPGWADTPGVARSLPAFRRVVGPLLRTPTEGADTLVWLAVDDAALADSGLFWLDRLARPVHRFPSTRSADTPEARDALLAWVDAKVGFDGLADQVCDVDAARAAAGPAGPAHGRCVAGRGPRAV